MSVTAHRRWDRAPGTPRRPLAVGLEPCGKPGSASCGVQCCASVMQWLWVQLACRARFGPRLPKARGHHGRALATRRNGPAVGHTPMLLLQLQLAGAPRSSFCCTLSAVRDRTPQERACVRACVCVHGGKLGVWAWAWGGWHRERGAAAQNALQQRSAVTKASAGSGGRKSAATAKIKATTTASRPCPLRPAHMNLFFFLRTLVRAGPGRAPAAALAHYALARLALQPEAVADGLGGRVQLGRQPVRVHDGPHPLPARLRVAERAHGVVDGRGRARRSLELGD